jgi:hypothetical protein
MGVRILLRASLLCWLLSWLGAAYAHPGGRQHAGPNSTVHGREAVAAPGHDHHTAVVALGASAAASFISAADPCPGPGGGCCCSAHHCTTAPSTPTLGATPSLGLRIAAARPSSLRVYADAARVQAHEPLVTARPRAPPFAP